MASITTEAYEAVIRGGIVLNEAIHSFYTSMAKIVADLEASIGGTANQLLPEAEKAICAYTNVTRSAHFRMLELLSSLIEQYSLTCKIAGDEPQSFNYNSNPVPTMEAYEEAGKSLNLQVTQATIDGLNEVQAGSQASFETLRLTLEAFETVFSANVESLQPDHQENLQSMVTNLKSYLGSGGNAEECLNTLTAWLKIKIEAIEALVGGGPVKAKTHGGRLR